MIAIKEARVRISSFFKPAIAPQIRMTIRMISVMGNGNESILQCSNLVACNIEYKI